MTRNYLAGFGASLLLLSAGAAALAATDEEFLNMAIGINLAEISAGEMASEKGQGTAVKEFGTILIDHHMKANDKANRLATAIGMTPPIEPSEKARKEADALAALSGGAFDRAFAEHMAMGHADAIALFEDKADDSTNEVSLFAKSTLPDLRKHLEIARSMTTGEGIATAPGAIVGDRAMTGASTGQHPMVGAGTGSEPMVGAETGSEPMVGAASPAAGGGPVPATMSARPDGLQPADLSGMSSDTLIGATVHGADDQTLGEISQILLFKDGGTGSVDAIVIDVGGFLGIGEKPVAVAFKDLQVMTDADGGYAIYSKLTRDQLDGAAAYDAASFEKNRDGVILRSGG